MQDVCWSCYGPDLKASGQFRLTMAGPGWRQTVSEVYMAGSSRPIADLRHIVLLSGLSRNLTFPPSLKIAKHQSIGCLSTAFRGCQTKKQEYDHGYEYVFSNYHPGGSGDQRSASQALNSRAKT